MVGTRRVPGRRPYPAIFFLDQIFAAQPLIASESPFAASLFMQKFRECLRQSIRERFGHDRMIVVVVRLELPHKFVGSVTGCYRKCADVILSAALHRRDKISQRVKRGLSFSLPL